MSTETRKIELTETRYDHSDGEPQYTGMRGVRLDALTLFQSGRVFSTAFPSVYVSDGGDVEMGEELLIPRDQAAQWFRAVADFLSAAGVGGADQ